MVNGYIAFYKDKRIEVYADSSYEAQQKAQKIFGAKKGYEVSVHLAEKGGQQVVHRATDSRRRLTKSKSLLGLSTKSNIWRI